MWMHRTVVGGRVDLGEVVAQIIASWSPRDCVVAESNLITDPEVTHINSFRALKMHCTVGDTQSGAIVSENRCRGLRITEISKGLPGGQSGLAIAERSSDLGR